jgi:hypothetical protein
MYYQKQMDVVSEKFDGLLSLSDRGGYSELKGIYPEPDKRAKMVGSIYDFTSSFGDSPFFIYEKGVDESNIQNGYKPKKFKPDLKKELMEDVLEISEQNKKEEIVVGRIKITSNKGKTTRTIQEFYTKWHHSLSYSPEIINARGKQYILFYPIRCLFEKEDDYYIIINEQLDIIGTGLSREEAEINFNEEFDYLYARLNSLDDGQIGKKLLRVKRTLNDFVKEVR